MVPLDAASNMLLAGSLVPARFLPPQIEVRTYSAHVSYQTLGRTFESDVQQARRCTLFQNRPLVLAYRAKRSGQGPNHFDTCIRGAAMTPSTIWRSFDLGDRFLRLSGWYLLCA